MDTFGIFWESVLSRISKIRLHTQRDGVSELDTKVLELCCGNKKLGRKRVRLWSFLALEKGRSLTKITGASPSTPFLHITTQPQNQHTGIVTFSKDFNCESPATWHELQLSANILGCADLDWLVGSSSNPMLLTISDTPCTSSRSLTR